MFLGKYLHGIVLIIWELVVNSQANLNQGIALSFLGRFEEAKALINQDWALLYIAVYVYSIWDSYRCAVEIKKSHLLSEVEDAPVAPSNVSFFDVVILDKKNPWVGMAWSILSPGLGQLYGGTTIVGTLVFDIEQIRYLRVRAANMAHRDTEGNGTVQIIATFDHSPFVEMAIHDMEKLGVPSHQIVALPMENLETQTYIFDSIHRVDGRSVLDGAMMGGSIFAVFGAIYGFVLHWGPIIWGLIGLAGGFLLGLAIELAVNKLKNKNIKWIPRRKSEVILEVTSSASLKDPLIQILKLRKANGFVTKPGR